MRIYIFLPLLLLAACHSPHPGEIWHCGPPISRDVKIDSINRFNSVIYSWDDSSGHKNGLCAMELFQGNKIGEVKSVRDTSNSFWKFVQADSPTKPKEGDMWMGDSNRTHMIINGRDEIIHANGASFGYLKGLEVLLYSKRELDSAYRKGVKDGKQMSISDIYPNEWPPEHTPYYWLQSAPGDADFGQLYHSGRNKDSSLANKPIIDSLISDTLKQSPSFKMQPNQW